MVGVISGNSVAQHLYSTMQASAAKSSQPSKPTKAAGDESTKRGAEKSREMSKGEIIDTYA